MQLRPGGKTVGQGWLEESASRVGLSLLPVLMSTGSITLGSLVERRKVCANGDFQNGEDKRNDLMAVRGLCD